LTGNGEAAWCGCEGDRSWRVDRAGRSLDGLLDNIEAFTRATIAEL
jgi:hypothetical protein